MKKLLFLASAIIFYFFSASVFALEYYPHFGPIASRTQNPLYLLFLNSTPEAPQTLEKGKFQFSVEETVSNLLEQKTSSSGFLVNLDMELYRTAFNFSYGFYKNFEVGIQIPFLTFNGGFLDGFLQGYHRTFGFPSGGRDRVSNGKFTYLIANQGNTLYSVNPSTFGLSDLEIYLKHQILSETKKKPALSFRLTWKIPTGVQSRGLGSGSQDVDMNLSLEKSYKRLHSYTNVGYLVMGPFEPLSAFQQQVAVTFTQALEFNITHIASIIAQIQGNSPIFAGTGNPRLDLIPLDLVIGFKGTGPRKSGWEKFRWEFAFTEDPIHDGPSVDFSVRFNLGAKF